jgi:maltodextrin utilization protein YvdJ
MWSDVLVACAVCFGAADGVLISSARLGVLVMVGVTTVVLAAFAAFFLRVAKKGDSPLFSRRKGAVPFSCEERGQPAK